METNHIPEDLLRKLHALLAKTEDRGASAAEAESAALKVQELLLKHNLSLSDVEGKSKKGKRNFNKGLFDLAGVQKRHDSNWVACLINILSQHNLCVAIHSPMHKRMMVLGEAHNIEIILYFTDMLIPKIEAACRNAWGNYSGYEKRNTFRRGFLLGCVSGINAKLHLQKMQMEQQNNSITALVRVSNAELEIFKNEIVGPTAPNKKAGKTRKSEESRGIGFRAGQNMEMNKGLSDNSNPAGKLSDKPR
jgi:hypothetical protein